jgi:23S rRNA (adenine2030-N6)-methyltransferase
MNYRHAFHAGNFADVLKHAVLVRILLHLRGKPAPFRVIDTHAGAGVYDLAGIAASRAGEWQRGIGRLMAATLGEQPRALLAPYLEVVRALNPPHRLTRYPGSSALIRALLRPRDRLIACEREPAAAAALTRHLAGERRAKALAIDGWTAINAYLPPKERRGLVLIDPAFEDENEFARLAAALVAAHRKWASGAYLAWYPLTARARPDTLARQLRASGIRKILRAELTVAPPAQQSPPEAVRLPLPGARAPLAACGLIAINPPWTLAGELAILLPALATALSAAGGGAHRLDEISGER